MSTYIIKLHTDNDAFADSPGQEIARILRELADRIEGEAHLPRLANLKDVNGNRVGYAQARPTLHE